MVGSWHLLSSLRSLREFSLYTAFHGDVSKCRGKKRVLPPQVTLCQSLKSEHFYFSVQKLFLDRKCRDYSKINDIPGINATNTSE